MKHPKKHMSLIGAGVLLSLLATTAPVYAQDRGYWQQSHQDDNQDRDSRHHGSDESWKDAKEQEKDQRKAAHVSRKEQERAIREEQHRQAAYKRHLAEQQRLARRAAERLRQENRTAEYRQHQDYLARLAEQQRNLQRTPDYRSDPFYSTPSSYRYSRNGVSYQTNQYGAKLLREAVNNGYAEGYRSGTAGRRDNWRGDYRNVFAYQDANYGYGGQYISQTEYNYYFRQGFQRGYNDGFGDNRRYGDRNNSVLGDVLSEILNLQSMR